MSSYTFDKVDPEEIIEKLERLIEYVKNKKLSENNNEKNISNSSSS